MKSVMISHPMSCFSGHIAIKNGKAIAKALKELGYMPVNSYLTREEIRQNHPKHAAVFGIAKSIEVLSKCDAIYFAKGWEISRGCIIEHEVAKRYGIEIFYEEQPQ